MALEQGEELSFLLLRCVDLQSDDWREMDVACFCYWRND